MIKVLHIQNILDSFNFDTNRSLEVKQKFYLDLIKMWRFAIQRPV